MQILSSNNVKIYNLSAGKSLPEVKSFLYILKILTNTTFETYSGCRIVRRELYRAKTWM